MLFLALGFGLIVLAAGVATFRASRRRRSDAARFRREVARSDDFEPLLVKRGPQQQLAARSRSAPAIVIVPEIHHEQRKSWHLQVERVPCRTPMAVTRTGAVNADGTDGLPEVDVVDHGLEGLVFHGAPGPVHELLLQLELRTALVAFFHDARVRSLSVRDDVIRCDADLDELTLDEARTHAEHLAAVLDVLVPALPALADRARAPLSLSLPSTGSMSGAPVPVPLLRR